jgi:hypothetical protein
VTVLFKESDERDPEDEEAVIPVDDDVPNILDAFSDSLLLQLAVLGMAVRPGDRR